MVTARSLQGLRVLVTGASSGIGARLSTMLAERGARVAGTGRDGDQLGAVHGLEHTLALDLLRPDAPARVVSSAADALGGLDIVVSGAGAGWSGPYEDMAPEDMDRALDLNLRVPMHLARHAAPWLFDSPAGGHLVLVGSIAGLVGVGREVAYGSAKAGLRGLADGLRAEWSGARFRQAHPGAQPVTVTLVNPGPVDTAFFARRNRPYDHTWPKPICVDRVARAMVSALERRQTYVVVPAWLGVPARLNGGVPQVFARLQRLQDYLPY